MRQEEIDRFVLELSQAEGLKNLGVVQSLWSGYGSIDRIGLEGTDVQSVIVKRVQPGDGGHPRGWNTDLSHQRKLKSYQVESQWYRVQSNRNGPSLARIPDCLGVKTDGDETLTSIGGPRCVRVCR